jgi:hypothetical protein
MAQAAAVAIRPHDLAAVVDPVGLGVAGAGGIDGGERVNHIGPGVLHAAQSDDPEQEQ